MELEFTTFVRKPFTVEAVEITLENIEQIAEFVGEIQYKGDGVPFIKVNRRLVPNVLKVHPGFWMTRMNDNIRCYSKKIFLEQFAEHTVDIQKWVDFMNGNVDVGEYGRVEKPEPGADG